MLSVAIFAQYIFSIELCMLAAIWEIRARRSKNQLSWRNIRARRSNMGDTRAAQQESFVVHGAALAHPRGGVSTQCSPRADENQIKNGRLFVFLLGSAPRGSPVIGAATQGPRMFLCPVYSGWCVVCVV